MGNLYHKYARFVEHPCAHIIGMQPIGFKCGCGHESTIARCITMEKAQTAHMDHVVAAHTQKEAKQLLPWREYHKAYNTFEYQQRKKRGTRNRKMAAAIGMCGLKKVHLRIFKMAGHRWMEPGTKNMYTQDVAELMAMEKGFIHECPDCGGDGVAQCKHPDQCSLQATGFFNEDYQYYDCKNCNKDGKVFGEFCETCDGVGVLSYTQYNKLLKS